MVNPEEILRVVRVSDFIHLGYGTPPNERLLPESTSFCPWDQHPWMLGFAADEVSLTECEANQRKVFVQQIHKIPTGTTALSRALRLTGIPVSSEPGHLGDSESNRSWRSFVDSRE